MFGLAFTTEMPDCQLSFSLKGLGQMKEAT